MQNSEIRSQLSGKIIMGTQDVLDSLKKLVSFISEGENQPAMHHQNQSTSPQPFKSMLLEQGGDMQDGRQMNSFFGRERSPIHSKNLMNNFVDSRFKSCRSNSYAHPSTPPNQIFMKNQVYGMQEPGLDQYNYSIKDQFFAQTDNLKDQKSQDNPMIQRRGVMSKTSQKQFEFKVPNAKQSSNVSGNSIPLPLQL